MRIAADRKTRSSVRRSPGRTSRRSSFSGSDRRVKYSFLESGRIVRIAAGRKSRTVFRGPRQIPRERSLVGSRCTIERSGGNLGGKTKIARDETPRGPVRQSPGRIRRGSAVMGSRGRSSAMHKIGENHKDSRRQERPEACSYTLPRLVRKPGGRA